MPRPPIVKLKQVLRPESQPRGGLAVVARAHKCCRSDVSILFFPNLAVANLYRRFWCCSLCWDMEQSATYVALLEHVKPAWLRAIRPLPPGWLIAPATGEVFKGNEHCHQRVQSMILTECRE